MKIKIVKICQGSDENEKGQNTGPKVYRPGEVCDVGESLGKNLIAAGYAEPADLVSTVSKALGKKSKNLGAAPENK
jgi:hypothetical protein